MFSSPFPSVCTAASCMVGPTETANRPPRPPCRLPGCLPAVCWSPNPGPTLSLPYFGGIPSALPWRPQSLSWTSVSCREWAHFQKAWQPPSRPSLAAARPRLGDTGFSRFLPVLTPSAAGVAPAVLPPFFPLWHTHPPSPAQAPGGSLLLDDWWPPGTHSLSAV